MVRIAFLLVAGLCGCTAKEPSSAPGIFTVAVAGEQILVGRSRTYGSSGTFELRTLSEPAMECHGRFRYSAPPTGTASFDCSNGERGTLRIRAEGNYVGSGEGASSFGRVRALFGYSLWEVNNRLMPAGKKLVTSGDRLELVDVPE
jgi:hypothetical protein